VRGFRRFSALALGFTLLVILWGAYVRASGSGAGCGNHWPTCNGEVVPRPKSQATVIEFTHRATSGLAFLMVAGQLVWALRLFPRGHGARRAAVAAMALMVTEAGVGAGLVLFEMVAGNKSVGRAAWMAAHLLNTFLLIGAMTLTRHRAASPAPARPRPWLLVCLAGVLLVAMSGAVAALGDTLFPARSLTEGMAQDLSPAAHVFVRLRMWHPVLAVGVGGALLALTGSMVLRRRSTVAMVAAALVLAQLGAGLLNVALLAPLAMQLVHLLLADFVWIALVLLAQEPSAALTSERASAISLSR
jgi:heme A synthase